MDKKKLRRLAKTLINAGLSLQSLAETLPDEEEKEEDKDE